jgi:hypothetical protein
MNTSIEYQGLQIESQSKEIETLDTRFQDALSKVSMKFDTLEHDVGDMQELVPRNLPLKESQPLDGIIAFLTRKHGGNVHDKQIVEITSSSTLNDNPINSPKNVADLTSPSNFVSENLVKQWVCWDFGKLRVRPKEYVLQGSYQSCLRSWVLEASDDGKAWKEIDRRLKDIALNQSHAPTVYKVSSSEPYKYFRLTQIHENHSGNNILLFTAFEIFGTLLESREHPSQAVPLPPQRPRAGTLVSSSGSGTLLSPSGSAGRLTPPGASRPPP